MMHDLAEREDVIALAFHVDYWDYIGWKDSFGDPAHAKRQKAYAAAGNRRSIYTPEMVVQGQSDIVGAKPMKLSEAIAKHARQDPKVALTLSKTAGTLDISAQVLADAIGPMQVSLLRVTPMQSVEIRRGENRGKTLEYANVVSDLQEIALWDGKAPLALNQTVAGDQSVVVIIQGQKAGPIYAAGMLR
jgi:hypothetical protein